MLRAFSLQAEKYYLLIAFSHVAARHIIIFLLIVPIMQQK